MDNKVSEMIHEMSNLCCEIDALYHQAALKLGVADSTMRVLYTLLEDGESCLLSDVYKKSGVNKQTINSAIRKLEGEGILYLEAADGRSKRVLLTEKGKKYLEKTAGELFALECRAFSSWSSQDMDTYIRLMKQDVESFSRELRAL